MPNTAGHQVEWTPTKVADFWHINHLMFSRRRFSKTVSKPLTDILFSEVAARGSRVMDFGCGEGSFLKEAFDSRTLFVGHDFEPVAEFVPIPSSVDLNILVRDKIYFAPAEMLRNIAGSFDAVVLIEVVEHLSDEALGTVAETCRSLLRSGGRFLVTTPNQEDLISNTVNCPDCGCIFHRVQHVRAWSAAELTKYMVRSGFNVKRVFSTDLGMKMRSPLSRYVRQTLDWLDRRKMPHLIGIFEKP